MTEKGEGALSRWSRLKREQDARGGEDAGEQPVDARDDAPSAEARDAAEEARAEMREVTPIREEDLPDIKSLTYDSDFTAFMQEGVPDALRNRALAMLWKSNPVLANIDGLNDYDLDYTIKEFTYIAAESAEDLRSGKKRENANVRRREERDRNREVRRRQTAEKTPKGTPQEEEESGSHDGEAAGDANSAPAGTQRTTT